ncbi:hypothetical protein CPAR01_03394 [Colletotrichum paranaense]|uniref:Cytochrome P450 n=1 Tax=Colletotrichum paranaense TaxID=1914294 RepID=A0ABQ9T287_9PEZI|nr:uncharacterized protein CPAR01_03394 [Colletotrichum paranaense]KAK1545892.1 hypothetical protein CPAR01_03394 [Colletotrichum paranaense]
MVLIPVYFIAGLLYNAYFHPLAKFPGPLYARCSDIPYMAVHTKGEMLPWLSSLHAKYGDVVRIGASRLSIINGQAWKDIYAHKTGGKKNFPKDPRVYGTDPNGHRNLITTLPDSDHSRLRRVFSPAFSERSLKAQAPLILSYVDQLIGNICRGIQTDSDAKFDMVKLYNLTTFDIMAELAFGESLGLLADSEYSEWVANIFDNLKNGAFAQVGREWSWLGNIVKLITPPRLKQAADMHFRHSIERVDRRLERDTDKADIWKLVLSQPEGKQIDKFDMYNNASVFMVAGSETTATILSGVTYLLLRNPDKLARLVSEIRGVDSEDDLDVQRLSALPYMTAVLNEALRWYPPVPVGVWREVPEGGSAVAGHWIPEKTRVSVPQFPANHSPRNFKDPEAFIPERWIPGPEYEPNTKEVVQPFSIGPRNCIGINLAWHEMRLILAKTLWNFDLSLCQENKPQASTAPATIKVGDRAGWLEALRSQRPVLVHLNADTTWLIQLPYPPLSVRPAGRKRFNVLIDPWLQGPQSDVASWFSTQWHVVEPSLKTMDQLNSILAGFEDGSETPKVTDRSYIDVVAISHEFTDHCHQATLEELPKSTPVFATDKAADLIRSWSHFSSVTTTPGFSSETKDWKSDLSISGLPPWVGIGRVITEGNALYYHSAIMIAFDSETPETILYSPHGIQATDLECIRKSGFSTLALLHGLHDVRIWMTKQLNLGALNGIQAVAETGARYWVATHDETKEGGGLIAPLLMRTQYTLKQAVEAEEARMNGKVPEYDFVELGSGDGLHRSKISRQAFKQRIGEEGMREYILRYFDDGAWLSSKWMGDMMDMMAANVFGKFKKFALIRSMKTANKREYKFLVTSADQKVVPTGNGVIYMNQEAFESKAARMWYDNNCIALSYAEIGVDSKLKHYTISDSKAEDTKHWIRDFRAALINNYECYKLKDGNGKLDDPVFPPPFDAAAMIEYPVCFCNMWSKDVTTNT